MVAESPSENMAAVVYSIAEVTNNWYVGLLAVLCGDPAHPQILLRPDNFGCTPALRWLDSDRYLCVQMSLYDRRSRSTVVPFCILDFDRRQFTFYPFKNPCAHIEVESGQWVVREWERAAAFPPRDGEIVMPEKLIWLPWAELNLFHEEYFSGVFG